jgi:hypothetical protein
MKTPLETTGFNAPSDRSLGQDTGSGAIASLVTSIGLVLGTVIVATVVSVGFAHAGAVDGVIDNEGTLFIAALLLGLVAFIGIGSISLLPPRDHRHRH